MRMVGRGNLLGATVAAAAVGAVAVASGRRGLDKEAALGILRGISERLGPWAIPAYVAAHTVTLALCLPYAVFFEAGAPVLFGFLPAVACVFSAKVLGASLSFSIGRFAAPPSPLLVDRDSAHPVADRSTELLASHFKNRCSAIKTENPCSRHCLPYIDRNRIFEHLAVMVAWLIDYCSSNSLKRRMFLAFF